MQNDINVVKLCALREGRIFSFGIILCSLIFFLYLITDFKKKHNIVNKNFVINLGILFILINSAAWYFTPKILKSIRLYTFRENELIISNLKEKYNMTEIEARKQLVQHRQSEASISAADRQTRAMNRNTYAILSRQY